MLDFIYGYRNSGIQEASSPTLNQSKTKVDSAYVLSINNCENVAVDYFAILINLTV